MTYWGLILNVVLFQVTWASAALLDEVYALISVCLLLLTLGFSALSRNTIIKRIVLAVLLGVLMDALMSYLGVYAFSETILIPVLNIPLWLLIMWIGFACSLCVSLDWAINKPVMFILLCAAFGPASYLLGVRLNIIIISESALFYMAIIWGTWAGCFLFLDAYLNQQEKDKEPNHEH
jgi:FtsH-binding integral membrane protein